MRGVRVVGVPCTGVAIWRALGVILLLACMVATACGSDGDETTNAAQREIAGTFDVGDGRKMYLECSGSGSPTVVLVSGLDIAGDLWMVEETDDPAVHDQLTDATYTCVYDRPGAALAGGGPSRSDPVPQPTAAKNSVSDLHALLTEADVPGPYLLVGHSYGGLVVRLYSSTYPDEAAGMVLVDSLSPELRAEMTDRQWETWKVANARTEEQIADYPDLERLDYDQTLDQVEAGGPFEQMPLAVLTADESIGKAMERQAKAGELPRGVPGDFGYVIDSAHAAAQQQVARLLDGAIHLTKTESGHNMMIDNPQLVSDAILDVLEAVRAERSTAEG